jgi:hypothetical protein
MFSAAENTAFNKQREQRNAANEPNRRVVILLFRPGAKVDPNRWPCPRVAEPSGACRQRFWSDASERRTFQAGRRVYEQTRDTFACRFYDRLTAGSPCEKLRDGRVPVLLEDPFLGFLSDLAVQVTYASGAGEALTTDRAGIVRVLADKGAYVDLEFTTSLRKHALRIFVFPESTSTDAGAWQHLVNLGFVATEKPPAAPPTETALERPVSEFQAAHGITPTGALDEKTRAAIKKAHEAMVPWSEEERALLADDKRSESASLRKDALA